MIVSLKSCIDTLKRIPNNVELLDEHVVKTNFEEFAGDYLPEANNFICEIHSWKEFWEMQVFLQIF